MYASAWDSRFFRKQVISFVCNNTDGDLDDVKIDTATATFAAIAVAVLLNSIKSDSATAVLICVSPFAKLL